ncbi:ABC transporter substrate-binding protein [Cellulomonas fimi]|uniref:Extracellular solute-binding protein family 1 n=1 Tax=Cellulomonas fimi (strain ATCC 484 / DSM 20113 / JCM 1341 / CCUG 24087 / LMG 16345 / NBRC 15513 / NCIMB 8980 / NCTC 7547 / NRS-133) TaxID=590998 RepID=F4H6U2_CELFA|nr:extracellular solute-binding protein [Cellulomonas fimi]AEE46853.1 extracellular solute-binding protein family 1 [Cellulomonas fimi ATCC 484]NNH06396.1 extracellular solute-binding protein [Cellulomonas fimi]VEH34370.1 Lactose-binding protein precursor [Cellulomonas fimi]
MNRTPVLRGVAVAAGLALLGACGTGSGGNDDATSGDATTITWWHNSNTGDGKEYYDKVAADFEAANPGVTVEVSAMQHEDMLTKLDAAFQANDAPDVYMERGGGELADHVEAGLTKDISEAASEEISKIGGSVKGWQVDGKTYALPFSVGVVGFWYNTEIFEQAGITEEPESWGEFYDVVDKLKAAGVEPVSVGAGDKWPAAHYWYYFSLRECSEETLTDAVTSLDFSDECFVKAGEDLEELVAAEPFNAGFLSTGAQAGATSASGLLATGKVAMELQGHWEPGVMQGLTEDGTGLGDKTGWFAFPAVDGGQGAQAAALGGGDAWAVSQDAPDAAVDFVKYLLSDEVQKGFAELDMGLPTNPTATQYVSDPALAGLLEVRDAAPYVQLYFDTAFGASVGGAMNDEIALLFAGQATPQDIVDATQAAADAEK